MCFSVSLRLPLSTADLVHHIADLQDPRLLHSVQLPKQRRRFVDVLLRWFALPIAVKEQSSE